MEFIVTIDRENRGIYVVDAETHHVSKLLDVPLLFLPHDPHIDPYQRGLKSIQQPDGGLLVTDVYGIFLFNRAGNLNRYLSSEYMHDLHSARLTRHGGLLITNTGLDQVLEIDWEGRIGWSLEAEQLVPPRPDKQQRDLRGVWDLRNAPLSRRFNNVHCNWAEWIDPQETLLMLSLFHQGQVLLVDRDGQILWRSTAQMSWVHGPILTEDGIYVCSSADGRICRLAADGQIDWQMSGFDFAKDIDVLPDGSLIVADTKNQRLVRLSPEMPHRLVDEYALPGQPYEVELLGVTDLHEHYRARHDVSGWLAEALGGRGAGRPGALRAKPEALPIGPGR